MTLTSKKWVYPFEGGSAELLTQAEAEFLAVERRRTGSPTLGTSQADLIYWQE